jgi:hypothetical protein
MFQDNLPDYLASHRVRWDELVLAAVALLVLAALLAA